MLKSSKILQCIPDHSRKLQNIPEKCNYFKYQNILQSSRLFENTKKSLEYSKNGKNIPRYVKIF